MVVTRRCVVATLTTMCTRSETVSLCTRHVDDRDVVTCRVDLASLRCQLWLHCDWWARKNVPAVHNCNDFNNPYYGVDINRNYPTCFQFQDDDDAASNYPCREV